MADFSGQLEVGSAAVAYFVGDGNAAPKAFAHVAVVPTGVPIPDVVQGEMFNLVPGPGKPSKVVGAEFDALFIDYAQPDWFENYHVIPRALAFGSIFSAQTQIMTIFSGFRKLIGTWTSFTNNAGAGVTLTGGPSLPATMYNLEGYNATVNIATSGQSTVDSTLDFLFDGVTLIQIPITLTRLVLFPIKPEIPYREILQFKTDVIPTDDGSSQRIAVRKNPRQIFEWQVKIEQGLFDQSRVNVLLFDWQGRTWGVPIWKEGTLGTVAIAATDTTINVESTDFADYRVDGLAVIYQDSENFEVLTVDSFTANTITFSSGVTGTYAVGVEVAPLRSGTMESVVSAGRNRLGGQTIDVRFKIGDNDANLADTSAFGTYNSKVLVDSCNVMRSSSMTETFNQRVIVIDNGTGQIFQDPIWGRGKRGSTLTMRSNSRSETWDIRGLLHALRGRQISFYVPTFLEDLLIDDDLSSGSDQLNVVNVGYTQFVQSRQPKNHVWIRLNDGSTLLREVLSSAETSSTRETLTVDSNWSSTIAQADIERICFLEEVNLDTDEIILMHERGERLVHVTAPILPTFD
jgi:hypothetical protein